MPFSSPTEVLQQVYSGATAVVAGAIGRMMVHAGEVQRGRRRFWSKALGLEMVTAVGMGLVLDAAAGSFGLVGQVRVGFVVGGSYIGPRIIESLWEMAQANLKPP